MGGDSREEKFMTAALQLPEKQDWTVDDLASLPEGLRYELIDGRLILPAPTPFHQRLGHRIAAALETDCPSGYSAAPDCSLEIDRNSEPRPDVVVMHDSAMMRTPAPIDKTLLVVEIVSPTSYVRDMNAKVKVYAAAGLEHYWVIDPTVAGDVRLTVFHLGQAGVYDVVVSTDKVFATESPYPITLDLPALTALRDKYLAAQEGA
jgi:Uma2 family endonuclease